jgi:hypothetical protein
MYTHCSFFLLCSVLPDAKSKGNFEMQKVINESAGSGSGFKIVFLDFSRVKVLIASWKSPSRATPKISTEKLTKFYTGTCRRNCRDGARIIKLFFPLHRTRRDESSYDSLALNARTVNYDDYIRPRSSLMNENLPSLPPSA